MDHCWLLVNHEQLILSHVVGVVVIELQRDDFAIRTLEDGLLTPFPLVVSPPERQLNKHFTLGRHVFDYIVEVLFHARMDGSVLEAATDHLFLA